MAEPAAPQVAQEPARPAPPQVKIKRPRQRACDQPDESVNLPAKNKFCCGHLKRWYEFSAEVEELVRRTAQARGWQLAADRRPELYRCEICKTIYLPDPAEMPRSYTHRF